MKKKLLSIVLMGCLPAMAQLSPNAPSPKGYLSTDNGLSKEVEMLNQQIEKDESLKDLELFTRRFIEEKRGGGGGLRYLPDTTCVVTIPVVFHVYHPNGEAGVPLSQIDFAIADLNKTFAGKDADYNTVNTAFSPIKSYTKIRFARALRDPKGNPTTGVVYYKDKQSGYGNGGGWDNQIASCAWDNYKYFNIYVMNDLYADNVTNNSGVCWYPSLGMNDAGIARMVYNYAYLGQGGASQNNLEFNQNFTHECGHFLNLMHTFDGNNCTGSGDNVGDTPPVDIAGAGCNAIRCSGLINGENYMDYNDSCYKNFTMGQNDRMEAAMASPSRASLITFENRVATGVLDPQSTNSCVMSSRFFAFSKTKLQEHVTNNGIIEMPPITIFACGGAQFAMSGALVQGTHYNITNIPAGLSVSIVVAANKKSAVLTFTGAAVNHAAVNSISNIQLTFTNAAVTGGNVNQVENFTKTLSVTYKDPWRKTCVTPNITTTSGSTWNSFVTTGPMPRTYGLWYYNGTFYLENYGRGIITTGLNSDNIQFINPGISIGSASSWRSGGATQGVLYSPSYTSLNNKTGYVGFRMQAGLDFYYGWMRISVSSTAGVTLLEYQYNSKPNEPILAGSACNSTVDILTPGNDDAFTFEVFPNPVNDQLSIRVSEIQGQGQINIVDVTGRRVLTDILKKRGVYEISVGHFSPGVYFVQYHDDLRSKTVKINKH